MVNDRKSRIVQAPPKSALIESMGSVGYSLSSALADIVDNAISAGASKIDIWADFDASPPGIAIIDDGIGMTTESDLIEAMRPGSKSPLDDREPSDLGRFGLGLKTASFSQCRRLTVVSKSNGMAHGACWDLDNVAASDTWDLEILDEPTSIPWATQIPKTGTLVLWEKLNSEGTQDEPYGGRAEFNRQIVESTTHLELVFHRYLSPLPGQKKLLITVNNRALVAFDPFNENHESTEWDHTEVIPMTSGDVIVKPFTLPHHRKYDSNAKWEYYGGNEGYLQNQGFYVYRQKRLIVYGTWFGLARQKELTKLSRVRIDITNDMDRDWGITLDKSKAKPPSVVRKKLQTVIERIGLPSKRIYTTRAMKLFNNAQISLWNRMLHQGEISYKINREHPLVADFINRLQPEAQHKFEHVLEIIAAALPAQAIEADVDNRPESITAVVYDDDALRYLVETTYSKLEILNVPEITEVMKATPPFDSNWERVQKILEEQHNGQALND